MSGIPLPLSSIQVIDSHTAGEPTRVVISGGPELGNDALTNRLRRFAAEHDGFRSAVVNEPRGPDVLVGGLLCEQLIHQVRRRLVPAMRACVRRGWQ
jgi:4-hydroxyproline epimerase